MASGLGYASGLLEGTSTLRRLSLQDRAQNVNEQELGLRRQQVDTQNQVAQSNLVTERMKQRQAEFEYQDQLKTRTALQNAFLATSPQRLAQDEISGTNSLADQTIQAGQALLKSGANPKVGMELIQQGNQLQTQASYAKYRDMQMKQAQMEMVGTIAGSVSDQESLDAAIGELSRYGTVVPEQYRKWTPETKEWLGRRAIASDNFLKSLQVQQTLIGNQIKDKEQASKAEYRTQRLKQLEEKEQRERLGLGKGAPGTKPLSQNQVQVLMSELAGDENFDDLGRSDKVRAVTDYNGLVTRFLANGAKDGVEARALARQAIVSKINSDGEYEGFLEKDAGAAKASNAPSQEEWLAAAKKANPGVPDDKLIEYYTSKYGNR